MTESNLTKRKSNEPAGRLNRKAGGLLKVVLPVAIVVMGILIAIAFVKRQGPTASCSGHSDGRRWLWNCQSRGRG
jgi:fumarate reductase subunit D